MIKICAGAEAFDAIDFSAGSMMPKIRASQTFVRATGGLPAIGPLQDAGALVEATAGTRIDAGDGVLDYYA